MVPLKKGNEVKQVVVPIVGTIADVKYDADEGRFTYLVEYTGEDGELTQRWFNHGELEVA